MQPTTKTLQNLGFANAFRDHCQSGDTVGARQVAWSDKDHEVIFAHVESFCIFVLIYL